MNDKKAKKVRKLVYGKNPRRPDNRYGRMPNGQVVCLGLRARYLKAKGREL